MNKNEIEKHNSISSEESMVTNEMNQVPNERKKDLSQKEPLWKKLPFKTRQRFLYAIPMVLLCVIVSLWISDLFRGQKTYYAKSSIVLKDISGKDHFIGTGNKIIITKNASIILQDDTIAIGDSLTIIKNKYLSDKGVASSFDPILDIDTIKDKVVIAKAKQDIALYSNNNNILYAQEKECFLVKDSIERNDSICLMFNNEEFWANSKYLEFDTIPTSDYNHVPFETSFVILDKYNERIAIRMNNLENPINNNDSSQIDTISIYSLYGQKLLNHVLKSDTTIFLNSAEIFQSKDTPKIRLIYPGKPSYVLMPQEAVFFSVKKEDLQDSSHIFKYLLSSVLGLFLIASLVVLFFFNKKRRPTSSIKDNLSPTNKDTDLEGKLILLKKELERSNKELARLQKVEQSQEETIRKIKNRAEEQVQKVEEDANKKISKANERANIAEEKARDIRQEVTKSFEEKITNLNDKLNQKQKDLSATHQVLEETRRNLEKKKQECENLATDLNNKEEALKNYSERITDVLPAGTYAKLIEKLLQLGHKIEKSAYKLLEKDLEDDYLLTKYITRYQQSIHLIDMDRFVADVLNIANVQFVYKEQPIAKYDQRNKEQFKESMKLFFFDSYLGKYINALVVFNETLAGLHHLVDGLQESDINVFIQYRKELESLFKELEIEVHSVKIFDSITDNVDLRVTMRPLEFDCPSGTICQIDSCLVYLTGGNKPNDKIHVIVKE